MKKWKLRASATALAACMAFGTAAPVWAESEPEAHGQSVMQTLLQLPLLGDFLRLLVGETEVIVEATGESATGETATPEEAATPETAPSATPKPQQGGVTTPVPQPDADDPEEVRMTAAQPQWGTVSLIGGTVLRAASREETNLGDLLTDAMVAAVRAETEWAQQTETAALPLAAVLPGRMIRETWKMGEELTDERLAALVDDDEIAVVVVTPAKLKEILNACLVDLLDSGSERFGNFLQISGLRYTYQTTNSDPQVLQIWLNGQGTPLDGSDRTTQIALAIPQQMRELCGVNEEAGYQNVLQQTALRVHQAVKAMPRTMGTDTLHAALARGGSEGRVLPVTAQQYTGMLITDASHTNWRVRCLMDGMETVAKLDETGCLILEGLAPGSRTVQMTAGEPVYYLSNVTHIGTPTGTAVTVQSIPEQCLIEPIQTGDAPSQGETVEPVPTQEAGALMEPTAVPQNEHPEIGEAIANGTWGQPDGTPTAVPNVQPAAPSTETKPSAQGNQAAKTEKATPLPTAQISDPSEGTLLGTTPAPTLKPTPTPAPTPEPTPDAEQLLRQEEREKQMERWLLYGVAIVMLACAVVVAIALIRRRIEDDRRDTYRKARK